MEVGFYTYNVVLGGLMTRSRPLRVGPALLLVALSLSSYLNYRMPEARSSDLPDLIPGIIHSVTPSGNETRICSGTATTFSTNVTNIGTATAGTFSVVWYVRDPNNMTIRGPDPGTPLVLGPLAPSKRNLTSYTPTPFLVHTGKPANYTVGIFVDPTNQINEGPNGKNNNRSERVFFVSDWPECFTTLKINSARSVVHIVPGETAAFTMLVNLTHGSPQQVTLGILDNQTVESVLRLRNITFSPASLMVNTSRIVTSSLNILTTTGTPSPVNYTLVVTGLTSTNAHANTTIFLDVGDPIALSGRGVVQGASVLTSMLVRVHGNLTFSYTVDFENSTAAQSQFGVNVTFSPSNVLLGTLQKETRVNLTINTSPTTIARNYRVQIFAHGDQVTGNGTLNLQVISPRDFFVEAKEVFTGTSVCVVPNLSTSMTYCQVNVTIYSGGSYNGTVVLTVDVQPGMSLTNLYVCPTSTYNAACPSSKAYSKSFNIASHIGKKVTNGSIILYLFFSAPKGVYTIDISTHGVNPQSFNPPGPLEFTIVATQKVNPPGVPLSAAQLMLTYTTASLLTLAARRLSGHARRKKSVPDQ